MRGLLALLLIGSLLTLMPGCKCGREAEDDPTDTLEQVSDEVEEGDPSMMEQVDDVGPDPALEDLPPEPLEADDAGDGAGLSEEDSSSN
ncbi:MAG: hypothetical protein KDD43_07785 [Bdellovibrionales bacterium]|nr:hypothetical protein [Bdellovibrionales bacterium]